MTDKPKAERKIEPQTELSDEELDQAQGGALARETSEDTDEDIYQQSRTIVRTTFSKDLLEP